MASSTYMWPWGTLFTFMATFPSCTLCTICALHEDEVFVRTLWTTSVKIYSLIKHQDY